MGYHIRDDGSYGVCTATVRPCLYREHYDTEAEARARSEYLLGGRPVRGLSHHSGNTKENAMAKATTESRKCMDEASKLKGQLKDIQGKRAELYRSSSKEMARILDGLEDKAVNDRKLFSRTEDTAMKVDKGRDDLIPELEQELNLIAKSGRLPVRMYSNVGSIRLLKPTAMKQASKPSRITRIRLTDTMHGIQARSTVRTDSGRSMTITTRVDPMRTAANLRKASARRSRIIQSLAKAGRCRTLGEVVETASESMTTDRSKEDMKSRLFPTASLRKALSEDVDLEASEHRTEHRLLRTFNDGRRYEVVATAMKNDDGSALSERIREATPAGLNLFRGDGVDFGPEGALPDVESWCRDHGLV